VSEVAPVALEAVPAAQGWQVPEELAPCASLKRPGGHGRQVVGLEAPRVAEYRPGPQGLQAAAPGEAQVPAGHCLHVSTEVARVALEAKPASHSEQEEAPTDSP